MKLPKLLGRAIYFFGYPIFRVLIRGTTRAYVAIYVDGSILLTKNWLGYQNKWRLPGGGVHRGEDIMAAVRRELKEEVGVMVPDGALVLLTPEPIRARFHYDYYLFACRLQLEPVIMVDEREILDAQFIAKKALDKHYLSEESTAALELLGWL